MLNSKSITLFACAWGRETESTVKAFNFCIKSFPYFDVCHFENKIDNLVNYNRFMVEELNSVIKTDFVLTIQSDGFIINPHLWQSKFFDYDYIGAPWPWHGVCGNGGFSLRSKKFLELSSKLKYDPHHEEYNLCPEDAFLCLEKYNRKFFIKNEIKFADIKTALEFSFEHPILNFPNHNKTQSFGFHGKFNL